MSDATNILKDWLTPELQIEIDNHPGLEDALTVELAGQMNTMQYLWEDKIAGRTRLSPGLTVQTVQDFKDWAVEIYPKINQEMYRETDMMKKAKLMSGKHKISDLYYYTSGEAIEAVVERSEMGEL